MFTEYTTENVKMNKPHVTTFVVHLGNLRNFSQITGHSFRQKYNVLTSVNVCGGSAGGVIKDLVLSRQCTNSGIPRTIPVTEIVK